MNSLLLASVSEPGFPVLTAIVVLPLIGAALLALLPNTRPDLVKQVAVLISAAVGAMSIWVLIQFETGSAAAEFQFADHQTWISGLGISWSLGVDGISLFLVVLTGVLFPIAMIAVDEHKDLKSYYAWILVLETGCMGAFLALDLFAFFVAFEIVLIPMYFMIGKWGHGDRAYAATKFSSTPWSVRR